MRAIILDIIMAAGIFAAIIFGAFTDFSQQCEAVQHSVLRLHIPANSDSVEDQAIKLKLRDMLLEQYGAQLSNCPSLEAAHSKVKALLPEIDAAADRFLIENGANYSADAQLVTMYFTTRQYGNVTLPAGRYDALRITLGSGEGHNWWCVMYPALCLSAIGDELPTELCDENTSIYPFLSDEPTNVEIRFALFEFLKNLFS